MRPSLVSVALLCFTTWMTLSDATHGPMMNCCEQWSTTKIPVNRVKNYTIQPEGSCPIKAVMILTNKGNRLCSNPDDPWTKKAMRKVDEERKQLLQESQSEEDGSTSFIAPAAAQVPQKKRGGRKGPRRNMSKRGKKGRRQHV